MRFGKTVSLFILAVFINTIIGTNANAATEEDILDYLKQPLDINGTAQNVKNDYIVRMERFYNTHDYTPEQYDYMLAGMKEITAIMEEEGRTDPTAMSWQAEHRVLRIIYDEAVAAGINVKYGKTDSSHGYLILYEKDGTKIDEIYYTENSFKTTGEVHGVILCIGILMIVFSMLLSAYRRRMMA